MSSVIKTHSHNNIAVLNQFTESSDSTLLYKGKPIIATSTHETEKVNTEKGIHGLRYYNSKLQYYNNKWIDIATGGGTVVDKDIVISQTANNALEKLSNGYYVQKFLISKQANNALTKYSDGYYVPKIPVNNATLDDIDDAKEELNDSITQNVQVINQKYTILTEKVEQISSSITKHKTHHFTGKNNNLTQIVDVSTLYNETENVILDMEFMIVNKSADDLLIIKITENNVETLNDTLDYEEVQRYKLTSTSNIKMCVKGNYELYLYVQYI